MPKSHSTTSFWNPPSFAVFVCLKQISRRDEDFVVDHLVPEIRGTPPTEQWRLPSLADASSSNTSI
ncbi:hypothetical protein NEOLEDRAFT_1129068 [Neolentinus lepideus HHB14362 ss-1]|uniref:Uncharacterized protein n=1 Tax=Neolentinus lepideus HHB14362 ss-1 TaxID=1314782 RepID=A0A165UX53_9AGAM|nr:hypothetical protein NEOLEDRAFT_1129068 [Neolentinus lepideus HHB14362 ss-1]